MRPLAVVTGGAGFIGHHLVAALLERGDKVRVIDDLSLGNRYRIPGRAEFIEGDVRGVSGDVFSGADIVYHLACNPSVGWSMQHPDEARYSVAGTTHRVLEASACRGVRKVVLASSCSVYGDMDKQGPASPYAMAKLEAERYCQDFDSLGYVATSVLRIFNVYGSGQRPTFVVPAMISAALQGAPIKVNGDGLQTRDFVHVETVVQALIATENTYTPVPIDVATGRSTSIIRLATVISALTRSGSQISTSLGVPQGESRFAQADVREMLDRLKVPIPMKLQSGLECLINHMRANG